jgi:NAD-specific glutamate dehydrogenase
MARPLLRRAADGQGLTRPELAVLLSSAKLALQARSRQRLPDDPVLETVLIARFPLRRCARPMPPRSAATGCGAR